MQITLTIPDELAVQAKTRGISVEEYVQSLLEEAGRKSPALQESRTPERLEAFFQAMAQGSQKLPALPTESFSRESFYEDRT
jgi:hypothetical protein